MVIDFSAGALPIGVKFCMVVRPNPGQVFYLGDSPRDGGILGVNRAPYGGICFLLKHLLRFCFSPSVLYTLGQRNNNC